MLIHGIIQLNTVIMKNMKMNLEKNEKAGIPVEKE